MVSLTLRSLEGLMGFAFLIAGMITGTHWSMGGFKRFTERFEKNRREASMGASVDHAALHREVMRHEDLALAQPPWQRRARTPLPLFNRWMTVPI